MQRQKLPINEIIVQDRQRDLKADHVDSLAASIKDVGLIQPIVVNQHKRLIAGAHRLAACKQLGWLDIDVVYIETLSEDEVAELELTEDVKRLDRTWQERCLAIVKIHALKKKNAALQGQRWGERETADLLGIKGASNVNYALRVGALLQAKDNEIAACGSLFEAWRVVMRREEDRILAFNAAQSGAGLEAPTLALGLDMAGFGEEGGCMIAEEGSKWPISEPGEIDASKLPDNHRALILELRDRARDNYLALNEAEARTLYLANPLNPPEKFDEYYKAKREYCSKKEQDRNTIGLSKMLLKCDCIDLMNANPERFDHIITDIPYGIDMDMLNQQNANGGLKDLATVVDEHDVEQNEALYERFFPAAFACLKPNAYCITWCDQMQWQRMYDLATAAGFKVQRWPITWVKSHACMNQCANTNFTKTTEIAIVCRKGVATLAQTNIPCHIVASHDIFKEELGHPFVKPFIVWRHLIEAVSLEGQLILEPFAGRGSGVISALTLNRHVVACESNAAHYNALVENVRCYYERISPNFVFA